MFLLFLLVANMRKNLFICKHSKKGKHWKRWIIESEKLRRSGCYYDCTLITLIWDTPPSKSIILTNYNNTRTLHNSLSATIKIAITTTLGFFSTTTNITAQILIYYRDFQIASTTEPSKEYYYQTDIPAHGSVSTIPRASSENCINWSTRWPFAWAIAWILPIQWY